MLAERLVTAGLKKKGFGLADLCSKYLNLKLPKELQESNWQGSLTKEQLEYAARDASVLLPLYHKLTQELQSYRLMDVAKLEFACLPVVTQMELNGFAVDRKKLKKLRRDLTEQVDLLTVRLTSNLGNINFESPVQVKKSLASLGIEIASTAHASLLPLAKDHPVINDLLRYRKITKLQIMVWTLLKHFNHETGRIHASYNQLGAASGRFSCREPNLQQIPRDMDFRQCFMASPEHCLVVADYSQIELRIAAELSRDRTMCQAFLAGTDLHALTATLLSGKRINDITKEDRQAAKAVNFGLIYGMGAETLADYAFESYGVKLTKTEAERFRKTFFRSYQGIATWHKSLKQKNLPLVRTIGGRLRKWKSVPAIPQLANSPVQGTGADILKTALVLLAPRLDPVQGKIIAVVHDEVVVECPQLYKDEAATIIKAALEEAGQQFLRVVPVKVDVNSCTSWAEK